MDRSLMAQSPCNLLDAELEGRGGGITVSLCVSSTLMVGTSVASLNVSLFIGLSSRSTVISSFTPLSVGWIRNLVCWGFTYSYTTTNLLDGLLILTAHMILSDAFNTFRILAYMPCVHFEVRL